MAWILKVLKMVSQFLGDHPEVLALIQQAIAKLGETNACPKKCCDEEVECCLTKQEDALVTALEHNAHLREKLTDK